MKRVMNENHEHQWQASVGTLWECTVAGCPYLRKTPPEANSGFQKGAEAAAEGIEQMAEHAETMAREWKVKGQLYREIAAHARLIAKGRSG